MVAVSAFSLATARLHLRPVAATDLEALVTLHADPEVMRYVGAPTPMEYLRDDVLPRWAVMAARFPGCGFFAAQEAATGVFIGWFHLKPNADDPHDLDLGYRLARDFWGRGYGTEGSRALVAHAFGSLGARRLTAHALAANQASRHVLEKCGFHFAGFYHETRFPGGAAAVRYELAAGASPEGGELS